jgi:hypothetical protein
MVLRGLQIFVGVGSPSGCARHLSGPPRSAAVPAVIWVAILGCIRTLRARVTLAAPTGPAPRCFDQKNATGFPLGRLHSHLSSPSQTSPFRLCPSPLHYRRPGWQNRQPLRRHGCHHRARSLRCRRHWGWATGVSRVAGPAGGRGRDGPLYRRRGRRIGGWLQRRIYRRGRLTGRGGLHGASGAAGGVGGL